MGLPALRTDLPAELSAEQVDLIKRTIAKGATDDELQMFLHICQRTGLDPFAKQIYAVKRWDKNARREVMAVQTGIDGYRLVAERTGRYAPGREPSYTYETSGVRDPTKPQVATATSDVRKQTPDGTWHEVAATAHYAEYVQVTKEGAPTKFWQQMPHVMLAKVAEALALRRAFPADLSGIYTHEEMAQADTGTEPAPTSPAALPAPRRASASASPAPSVTEVGATAAALDADATYEPYDSQTGEPLTLDGELSDEERYGKFVTPKEIGSLMAALEARGISSEQLRQHMLKTWKLKTRKALRKAHLIELGKWIAGEREVGEEG